MTLSRENGLEVLCGVGWLTKSLIFVSTSVLDGSFFANGKRRCRGIRVLRGFLIDVSTVHYK